MIHQFISDSVHSRNNKKSILFCCKSVLQMVFYNLKVFLKQRSKAGNQNLIKIDFLFWIYFIFLFYIFLSKYLNVVNFSNVALKHHYFC